MENACKKVSWLNIVSIVVIVAGALFGVLASLEVDKSGDASLSVYKWLLMGVSILLAIILTISCVISFISMRQGNVKSVILALGKNTKFQSLAPFATMVLAVVGLVNLAQQGQEVGGSMVFVIVSYAVVVFAFGFNSNSLKAYRKDKETYSYTAITSFISVIALLVFAIGASIAMVNIPAVEGSHLVGYLETFAILFTAADLLAYLMLGIVAIIAKKYAPKLTISDADASKLDDINNSIDKLAAAAQNNASSTKPVDNVTKLREYKKLLDEGIITKEEFEAKKKELL